MLATSLAAAAAGWLLLLLLAPALPAPIAALVYVGGSLICHQRPDRSFHVDAAQLPVCARCVGIYAGAAAIGLAWLIVPRLTRRADPVLWTRRAGRVDNARPTLLIVAGALPTAVTLALEWSGLWSGSNGVRAAAGAVLGATAAFVVLRAARPVAAALH